MATSINSLYMLTGMTGRRANENRTIVVATFEMKSRHFWIAAFALVPGLLMLLILMPAIGQWSILAPVIIVGLAFLATEARTRTGLKQRVYRDMVAKARSQEGKFLLCGHEVNPTSHVFGVVSQTAVPLQRPASADRDELITITTHGAHA